MKNVLQLIFFSILLAILISCEKEQVDNDFEPQIKDTTQQAMDTVHISISDFLFNIPVKNDTLFVDKQYGIDFRMEIEGFQIDTVEIKIDNSQTFKTDTFIVNTRSFYYFGGIHQIEFFFKTVNLKNNDTVYFHSGKIPLKAVDNLSTQYVNVSNVNGSLTINWPELDKKNTSYYLVERFMGDNKEYLHKFEADDSVFTDNFYVGEEVTYKISVINDEGGKQNIWCFQKEREAITFSVAQHMDEGYDLYFSSCRYYNNLGEYYLTTGMNDNPELLYRSGIVSDTLYHDASGRFTSEVRYWLRYLPKEFPEGVSEKDWQLYGHFIYARYGEKSFDYDYIVSIGDEKVAYTKDGNIYTRDLKTNNIIDSISNPGVQYGVVSVTPQGKYIYARNEKLYGSPIYFWSATDLSSSPLHTFQAGFSGPSVSDSLVAIMPIPNSSVSPTKLALYNIINGDRIFITPYEAYSMRPSISSNGKYFFIVNSGLKLCSYVDNSFTIEWEEYDRLNYYNFYSFNPVKSDIYYLWDVTKKFTVKSIHNHSVITSFQLDVEGIISVDYYNDQIMGYTSEMIRIYDLNNGQLKKEIPAFLGDFFWVSQYTLLAGNKIYSKHGLRYEIFPD